MTLRDFFLPRLTPFLLARTLCIALVAFLVFGFFLRPAFVQGPSMLPTYSERGVNFCVLNAFRHRLPKRGQVVILRYGGPRRTLLKRVLAFEGETVEFRNGTCYVNGAPLDEPYVKLNSGWTIPPLTVEPGYIYVMGDNRSLPPEQHVGGEIARARLLGRPLF